jgi:hypothetical protein
MWIVVALLPEATAADFVCARCNFNCGSVMASGGAGASVANATASTLTVADLIKLLPAAAVPGALALLASERHAGASRELRLGKLANADVKTGQRIVTGARASTEVDPELYAVHGNVDIPLAGIPPLADAHYLIADAVCADVARAVRAGELVYPTATELEVPVVHPFLNFVFDKIAKYATAHSLACVKTHYEATAQDSEDQKRPDFVATEANERRHFVNNSVIVIEAKRVQESVKCSRDFYLREGVCDVLRYSVNVYRSDTSRKFVISTVHNGPDVVFTRVDFTAALPAATVTHLRLFPESDVDLVEVQQGLLHLVRLFTASACSAGLLDVLTRDLAVFGLSRDRVLGNPALVGLEQVATLACGGFADVYCVRCTTGASTELRDAAAVTDGVLAYKTARDTHGTDLLLKEAEVLRALQCARVLNVPRLHFMHVDEDGRVIGLVVTPVGVPLLEYIGAHPDRRNNVAKLVLGDVHATLEAAWGIGCLHGDVRPENLVVVVDSAGAPDAVILIDWGLGRTRKGKANVVLEDGDPWFLPCARLAARRSPWAWGGKPADAHALDLVALGLAYLCVRYADDGVAAAYPPWRIAPALHAGDYGTLRNEWLTSVLSEASGSGDAWESVCASVRHDMTRSGGAEAAAVDSDAPASGDGASGGGGGAEAAAGEHAAGGGDG